MSLARLVTRWCRASSSNPFRYISAFLTVNSPCFLAIAFPPASIDTLFYYSYSRTCNTFTSSTLFLNYLLYSSTVSPKSIILPFLFTSSFSITISKATTLSSTRSTLFASVYIIRYNSPFYARAVRKAALFYSVSDSWAALVVVSWTKVYFF